MSSVSEPREPGAQGAVVAYGYDPEPLACTNRYLLAERTVDVIEGLSLLVRSLGARRGILCVPGTKSGARAQAAAAGREELEIHRAPEVPLPRTVTVEALESLLNLSEAASGRPPTHTYVSCRGEVREPALLHVPLGTPVREIIAACGGPAGDEFVVLAGGVLAGHIEDDINRPVNAGTKSLLVLSSAHPLAQVRSRSLEQVLLQSRAACCGCTFCTAYCPAALAGEEISPHRIMRQLNLGLARPEETLLGALCCRECGVCEAVCVMSLSPRLVNRALKQKLQAYQPAVQRPAGDRFSGGRGEAAGRRLPASWFLARLGLESYGRGEPVWGGELASERVELELPPGAVIRAARGEDVRRGDMVAETTGWKIHAGISGRVLVAGKRRLVIAAGKGERH